MDIRDIRKKYDVLEALACLKAMCSSYDVCSDCPAFMGVCKIKDTDPEDYDLNTVHNIWRAFK